MNYKQCIKHLSIILVVQLCFAMANVSASDFIVDYYAEQYNEKLLDYGNELKIYHTLQIKTPFGSKLLILDGDDMEYRNWLRKYLSYENTVLVSVLDKDDQSFIDSKVFTVDVKQVHSVETQKWKEKKDEALAATPYKGKKHILLVDDNVKRLTLTKDVIENLGYPVIARQTSQDALVTFSFRPDKFNLLITNFSMPSMTGVQLAQSVMAIEPKLPVLFSLEYGQKLTDDMQKECTKLTGNYTIKEILLRETGDTIRNILGGKS